MKPKKIEDTKWQKAILNTPKNTSGYMQPIAPHSGPCPHCGYCPHCGRGGYPTYPAPHQWPYTQPYWIGDFPVTNGTICTSNQGDSGVIAQSRS